MEKKVKKLTNSELTLFFDQMGMVIEAGITPEEGIMILKDDAATEEGKEILDVICEKCEEGNTFADSLKASEVFPKYALDMVELGERTGNLEEVLHSLAFHYNREENIAKSIKNAVTYPFLIVVMMLVVILVLIVKVLPVFNQVFMQLGSEMTGFSKRMLDFGMSLGTYSYLLIGIVIALIICTVLINKTTAGKKLRSSFLAKFFLTKGIYEKIAVGRFASGMALTLSAGLDSDESLDMVSELVDNQKLKEKIDICRDSVKEGNSFSDAVNKAKIFSGTYSHMIMVGYRTGTVEKVFEKVADGYEEQVDEQMNNVVSVLEPTLVIVLSVCVCFILLSVMLPLLAVMTTIG